MVPGTIGARHHFDAILPVMLAMLTGTAQKLDPGYVIMNVSGVGYAVSTPIDVWDELKENVESTLHISTYVREDRLELFGFSDRAGLLLFEAFIGMAGIGPRLGLELCAVPRDLLLMAIEKQDHKLLTNVKGVGKKTAEKLLVDLKSLVEKQPEIFGSRSQGPGTRGQEFDQDAMEALKTLGYDTGTILQALKETPKEATSTEERVAAALRSM
jgi:Holliday junction DNA helicase RuvA